MIGHVANASGAKINPATQETSSSILSFISTVYDWFVSLFPWDLVSARQTARNLVDNQIIPAANAIKADRGIALPLYDYCEQTIVGDTATYVYKTWGAGGTTVCTLTVVFTDATLQTIVSITKT